MLNQKLQKIVQSLLEQPTAPFHEGRVREAIIQWLSQNCPHVELHIDNFGNLIAHYQPNKLDPSVQAVQGKRAFVAHMDHPGWVKENVSEDQWTFLGGVPEGHQKQNRDFIQKFGNFAMWDLPACCFESDFIYSRACDDLIGCATMVAILIELEERGSEVDCYALFTRAEEIGFLGTIKIAQEGWLQKENISIISLETSAQSALAKIGEGPIIRVGDKVSIFDPLLTHRYVEIAQKENIKYQRCLMSGGRCEATAFQTYGVRSSALCVALGNYHNCAPDKKIEPEFVSMSDFEGLVNLCVQIALEPAVESNGEDSLFNKETKRVWEKELFQYEPYFDRIH